MKRLSTLLMLTACLALNGCGLLGDSPETPEYKPSPVENFMANAVPGDITTLSDPAFGTDVRVSMKTASSPPPVKNASVPLSATISMKPRSSLPAAMPRASGGWRPASGARA